MLSEGYADITITGSNAHFLASDLTTFLSDRYIFQYLNAIYNTLVLKDVVKVINYLNYLVEGFLIHRARRFDMKGLRHLEITEKYFSGHIGLRHGLLGYKDLDIGGLLENIVCLELLHRGYSIQTGKWDDLEVDFIAEKQNERIYIQVAYLLPQPETIQRECAAREKIPDNYPKMILTMDEFQTGNRNGIKIRNLINFLLEGSA